MTKSGAPAHKLSKCRYFEQMQFLRTSTSNNPTHTNIHSSPANFQSPNPPLSIEIATTNSSPLLSPPPSSSCTGYLTPIPQQVTPTSTQHSKPPKQKRTSHMHTTKSTDQDSAATASFFQELSAANEALLRADEEKELCEDTLFCKSLIPQLKGLSLRKKRLAKIKISQLLFDITFDVEEGRGDDI